MTIFLDKLINFWIYLIIISRMLNKLLINRAGFFKFVVILFEIKVALHFIQVKLYQIFINFYKKWDFDKGFSQFFLFIHIFHSLDSLIYKFCILFCFVYFRLERMSTVLQTRDYTLVNFFKKFYMVKTIPLIYCF